MNWFTEIEGNILNRFDLYLDGGYRPWVDEAPADDFYLVHCVSGDNAQGAGFAKVLNDRYHFRDSLCADLAESFPGFGTTGWTFDKRFGDFFRISLLRDSNGEYFPGKIQRMKFEANIGHAELSFDGDSLYATLTFNEANADIYSEAFTAGYEPKLGFYVVKCDKSKDGVVSSMEIRSIALNETCLGGKLDDIWEE